MLASAQQSRPQREPVDIEPLLRYLEIKRKGSWAEFDAAVKEIIPQLESAYAVADRLAAQCFLEFDWRDRSWQFAPTTFCQAPPLTDGAQQREQSRSSNRWLVFGATKETVDHFCSENNLVPARSHVDIELPKYRLRFTRNAVLVDNPEQLFSPNRCPAILSRWTIEALFNCLPSIRLAAQNWIGEEAQVESAMLRAALQPEKADQLGNFHQRTFDDSTGLWRVDGIVRQYFWVSASPLTTQPQIVRTPFELGRWFDAVNPGTMCYDAVPGTMRLELNRKVFDLPVLFEKWLTLWGSRRKLLSSYPTVVEFDRIDYKRAKRFAQLLSLREFVNARFRAAPPNPN